MTFDELYQTYFKDIYRYVYGLSKNESLSEELTQETFFSALGALDRFDGRKDLRAWLFTIARNAYLSHCRKNRRISAFAPQDVPGDVSLVDSLLDDELSFAVHRFLHTMEEPYKEVFSLRVFGELPFEKIGMIFGKSAGWARVTYHRAKRQIIEYMEGIENGR